MEPDPLSSSSFRFKRRAYERILMGLLVAGALATTLGLALVLLQRGPSFRIGVPFALGGFLATIAAIEMGHPVWTLRTIGLKDSGGQQYDRRKRWTQFKTVSISLNLVLVVASFLLSIALSSRVGLLDLDTRSATVGSGAAFLALAVAILSASSYYFSLRTPYARTPSSVTHVFFHLLVALALLFGGFAATSAARDSPITSSLVLGRPDAPFLLLAAVSAAGVALFVSRRMPTIYTLFGEERDHYRTSYMSRNKSVVLPTMMAFALLFVVLLLAIVFQFGLVRFVQEIPRNAVLLGAVLFIVVAFAASLWVSVVVARREDTVEYYRLRRSEERKREIIILSISGAVTSLFLVVATVLFSGRTFLGLESTHWTDFLSYAVLTAAGPYGFYYARRMRRVRRLEERFPDFLRDLAASRKAGLTLPSAVTISARGEYGELTPEIQKMADQLALNTPFDEAITRFGQRVNTPLIQRAVVLINEAGRTGGQVTDVLEAAAIDAREIKTLENERHSTMMLYTIIIYIIFGVFLLVAAIMYGTFVPQLVGATEAAMRSGQSQVAGLVFANVSQEGYRVFYFLAAMVQGVGNGFIAGLIETGRARAGLRHSFVMVAITYVTFTMLI